MIQMWRLCPSASATRLTILTAGFGCSPVYHSADCFQPPVDQLDTRMIWQDMLGDVSGTI